MMKKEQKQVLKEQIIKLAWNDLNFRQKLMEAPHEAIRQWCGVDIPSATKIKVLYDSPERIHFVLPARSFTVISDDDLLDDDLDAVAGGNDGDTYTVDG